MRWLWLWKDTALGPLGTPMEQPAFLEPEGGEAEAEAPPVEDAPSRTIDSPGSGNWHPRRPRRPRRRRPRKPTRNETTVAIAGMYAFLKSDGAT